MIKVFSIFLNNSPIINLKIDKRIIAFVTFIHGPIYFIQL